MTVAQRGYSVTIPPMGTWVRQGEVRLNYPDRRRAWMTTPIGELEPPTSGWHRSTDRLDPPWPPPSVARHWTLRTRCGRGLMFEPDEPEAWPVRHVLEVAEFPTGRICSRCLKP